MADGTSQATHLAKLDFDISAIESQLKSVEDKVKETSRHIEEGFSDTSGTTRQSESFKQMGDAIEQTDNKLKSFLSRLGQKGLELASYQAVMAIQQAFSQSVNVIKETEDAVIDLQRVLNDDSLSNSAISKQLYSIADEYGQTFDNVRRSATLFAQAGLDFSEVVDATKATMLGLNTAELDIATATNGLIAVMKQFGYEASDLEGIIDQINITADNFAVTSEKIVAALQRVGSTATNAGMSLQETIGVITALSEATGRSGENIGTAMNSLIIYMSKASSLDTFAKLSDGMAETVRQYRAGAISIMDIWESLSTELSNLDEKRREALFDSDAYEDLARQLEEQATEYTSLINDVYGTAGAYRRNYLIALANNFDTVKNAIENLTNVEGYSLKENEKYMNTLTAQVNQLVNAAKELAVQFGESGFLDALKIITQLITGLLKLTNQLGGFNTVLRIAFTTWALLNQQMIATKWNAAVEGAKKLAVQLALTNQLAGGLSGSLKLLGKSILGMFSSNPLAIVGAAVTGFSMLKGVIDSYNQKIEEARRLAISEGEEASKTANDIMTKKRAYDLAKSAYDNAAKSSSGLKEADEKLKTASSELLTALGYESSAIEKLQGNYQALDETINTLTEDSKKVADRKLADSLQAQAEEIYKLSSGERLTNFEALYGRATGTLVGGAPDKILAQILEKRVTSMDSAAQTIKDMKGLLDAAELSLLSAGVNPNDYELFRQAYEWYDTLKEKVDAYADTLRQRIALNLQVKETEDDISDGIIPDYGITDADALSAALEELTSRIDEFQSAYSMLNDVVDEYNESGVLSSETFQKLVDLGPEFIDVLDITGNSISINKDKMDALISSNNDYMAQLAAMSVQEEYNAIMKRYSSGESENLTIANIIASTSASQLNGAVANLAYDLITGATDANSFAASLSNIGSSAGMAVNDVIALTSHILTLTNSLGGLFSKVGIAGGKSSTGKRSGGGGGGGGGGSNNEERKQLQAEIKEWQRKKDEAKDFYDQQIDALKEVKEANDRINDQLDYYNDRQKKVTDIEKARARSGVEYREKEMEYQQDMIDLEKKWNDKVNDWDIDDKIEELESLRDASVAEIEAIVQNLQDKLSSLSSAASGGVGGGGAAGAAIMEDAVEEATDNVEEDLEDVSDTAADEATDAFDEMQKEYLERMEKAREELLNGVDDAFFQMKDRARVNANDMYDAYKRGFITPLNSDIRSLMSQAMSVGSVLSSIGRTVSHTTNNSSTNYYNSRNTYLGDRSTGMGQTDIFHMSGPPGGGYV